MSADLMAFVITSLEYNSSVATSFGHSTSTPKFHADEVDPTTLLPFLVYSEPTETPLRVFTGDSICTGEFEIGVLDTSKGGARTKLDLVRSCLNGLLLPQTVNGGVLIFLRNEDNRSRPIGTAAPGTGVAEYGRAMIFRYMLTRSNT